MPALPFHMENSMTDKFTVDLDSVAKTLLPTKRAYRLSDVKDRIEKIAYSDLVRFRDNQDTDQLWKIQESPEGPVIIALYGDDGSIKAESNTQPKSDWEAIPDKKAMHIFYKGEPLVTLSSLDMGIPVSEFDIARRWIPEKLASDVGLQKALLGKASLPVRKLIAQRFPELTKVASLPADHIIKAAEDIMSAKIDAPVVVREPTELERIADELIKIPIKGRHFDKHELEELADILYNRASKMDDELTK